MRAPEARCYQNDEALQAVCENVTRHRCGGERDFGGPRSVSLNEHISLWKIKINLASDTKTMNLL